MIATDAEALQSALATRRAQVQPGAGLQEILEQLVLTAETAAAGSMLASVLLVDETGGKLRHGAAPNLPRDYCSAIDGIAIQHGVGSCGTAAFIGQPVYVTDIEGDPLWTDFRDLALHHGLRACWSIPILDRAEVIGAFAVYHHSPRSPTPVELNAIDVVIDAVRSAILDHRQLSST